MAVSGPKGHHFVVMPETTIEPSEEQIAELARKFWEEEGQPEGKAEEHWARAQQQLRNGSGGQGPDGSSAQAAG